MLLPVMISKNAKSQCSNKKFPESFAHKSVLVLCPQYNIFKKIFIVKKARSIPASLRVRPCSTPILRIRLWCISRTAGAIRR